MAKELDYPQTVSTLRNIHESIDSVVSALDSASVDLDIYSRNIAADTTLNESDRKMLAGVLEDTSVCLSGLVSACDPVAGQVEIAMNAFKCLPKSE